MKPINFSINGLIFAITSLVVLFFFNLYAFASTALLVLSLLAIACSVMGIIKGKQQRETSAIIIGILGIILAFWPLTFGGVLAALI